VVLLFCKEADYLVAFFSVVLVSILVSIFLAVSIFLVVSIAGAAAGAVVVSIAGAAAGVEVVAAVESVLVSELLPLPQEATKRPKVRARIPNFTNFIIFFLMVNTLNTETGIR